MEVCLTNPSSLGYWEEAHCQPQVRGMYLRDTDLLNGFIARRSVSAYSQLRSRGLLIVSLWFLHGDGDGMLG